MAKNKGILLGAAMVLLLAQAGGQAAEKNVKSELSPPAPTVIEAEQVYFSDKTGEMFARGNVKITQSEEFILADFVRGNQHQTMLWVDGSATLVQPNAKLTGNGLIYNYAAKTGSVNQVNGVLTSLREPKASAMPGSKVTARNEYLTGQMVQIAPEYLVAHDATYTGCDLKVPDYRVSAEKVELWPGDKLIAHNAKFWLKDTVVFAMPRYEMSLVEGGGQGGVFPSVGYSNDNGVYVRQQLSYPFNPRLQVYTNLAYYSKVYFKPQYGVRWDNKDYFLQVEAGHYFDTDYDVWLEKRIEYKLGIPKSRVGNLPLSYQFTAAYGKWHEDISAWRQEYGVYFTGDTIALDRSKTLNLGLGTGWKYISESHGGIGDTIWQYDIVLNKQWSPKFNTFVENHYTENYDSLFKYAKPQLGKELIYGFSYELNDRHKAGFKQSHNLETHKTYSNTYSWEYSMHCWVIDLGYTNYADNARSDRFSVKVGVNF